MATDTKELQLRLTINGQQSLNTISKLEIETEQLAIRQRDLNKAVSDAKKKYGETSEEYKKATKALADNKTQIADNNKNLNQLRESEGLMLRTTQSLNRELKEQNRIMAFATVGSEKYAKAQKKLAEIQAELQARKGSESFLSKLKSQGPGALIGGLAGGAVGVAATLFSSLASSVGNSIEKFAKLSDTLANIRKSTGLTTYEVAQLNSELGRIDTRTAKEELQNIVVIAGQLGVANAQILEFTKSTDKLNVALGDEFSGGAEEITNTFGSLRNVLTDIKTDNVGQDILYIGNAINVLGAEGLATGPVVADITNRIASAGQVFGVTSGQALGLAASYQEMGISSERGSTATVKLLEKMSSAPEEFAKIAGLTTSKFKELVNSNITEALLIVAKGFTKSKGNAIEFAQKLGDAEISSASIAEVLSKVGQNTELVAGKMATATKALKETTSITEEFNIKNNTAAADIEKAGKVWDKWITSIGSFLALMASPVITAVASFSNQVEDLNDKFQVQRANADKAEKSLIPLMNRYAQLQIEVKTNKEKQGELNQVIADIGKVVPNAITQFDNYGNALSVNLGLVNQYIKKQKELTKSTRDDASGQIRTKLQELNRERKEIANELKSGVFKYQTVGFANRERPLKSNEIAERQIKLKANKAEFDKLYQDYKELYSEVSVKAAKVTPSPTNTYKPEKSKADKTAENKAAQEAERLRDSRLDNHARLLAEIQKMEIEVITNESDKKEQQLRFDYAQDIAKEQKLVTEKKTSQADFDNYVIARKKSLNDALMANDKATNEKISKDVTKINQEAAKRVLESQKDNYEAELELAKANNDSKAELDAQINILIVDKELALLIATEEEKLDIIARFKIREQALKDKFINDNVKKEIKSLEELRKAQGEYDQIVDQKKKDLYQKIGQYVQSITSIVSELFNFEKQGIDNQQITEDNKHNQRIANLDKQKSQGIINEAEYNEKKTLYEKQYDDKSREIKKKAFEADKRARIAQIIMTTAQAVISALATVPPNPFMAIAAGVIGALQLANALNTEAPGYASGDFIGNSQQTYPISQKPSPTAQLIWANEKGTEFMLNNDAVSSPDFPAMLPLLRKLNAGKPVMPDISASTSPRVKRYERGDFITDINQKDTVNIKPIAQNLSNNSNNSGVTSALNRLSDHLDNGIQATVQIGYQEAQKIAELQNEIDKIKQKSNA